MWTFCSSWVTSERRLSELPYLVLRRVSSWKEATEVATILSGVPVTVKKPFLAVGVVCDLQVVPVREERFPPLSTRGIHRALI